MNIQVPFQFRLASYNIRKCVGLDRRRKPERILEVLNGLEANVIALQEADRRLGDRPAALSAHLIETETDFRPIPVGRGPSLGWHGNAILVHKGLGVSDISCLDLPGTEPRGALSATIGGTFRLTATHLGLRRSDRRRQAAVLATALSTRPIPAVIAGDLNEWSPSRGLEPLAQELRVISPGRSFHTARPVAALDRMALSDGLNLTDAGVFETRQSRIASDHLPVWADLRVMAPAPAG